MQKNLKSIVKLFKRRLRVHAQLLIVALNGNSADISLWQGAQRQWEEAAAYTDDAALEKFLRDSLLQHDAEENITTLVLLAESLLESEQLTLPRLDEGQLRKTMAWEAAQAFALPVGSYSYCYQLLASADAANAQEDEGQQVVQLYALAHERQAYYRELGKKLLLNVGAISVSYTARESAASSAAESDDTADMLLDSLASRAAEHVARQWFAGEELLRFPPPPTKVDWAKYQRTALTFLPHAACGCVLLALLFAGGCFIARYVAASELQELQRSSEQYALWQQRRKESMQREKRLAQLQKQAEQRKETAKVSKELEAWGRLQLDGVYLAELEYKTLPAQGGRQVAITVQGAGKEAQAVEQLVEALQRTARYSSVNMVESKATGAGVAFSLQLVAAGGTK